MNGTRLSEDWQPDPSLLAWAKGRRPDLDIADTIEQFKDYWLAKTGKDATKLCWNRTFRNWVRSARAAFPLTAYKNHQGTMQQFTARPARPASHAPAKPALDRLPDDKRRENLERLSGMFDNLFQKVMP